MPDLAAPIFSDQVLAYLRRTGGDNRFKAPNKWNGDIFDEKWLAEVDAAELIKEACNEMSGNRLTFAKTGHSLELLKHILTQNRNRLDGLIEYVKQLFALATAEAE